jgi:hypothetical protein
MVSASLSINRDASFHGELDRIGDQVLQDLLQPVLHPPCNKEYLQEYGFAEQYFYFEPAGDSSEDRDPAIGAYVHRLQIKLQIMFL